MNVAVDVNMDAGDGEVWGSSICFRSIIPDSALNNS